MNLSGLGSTSSAASSGRGTHGADQSPAAISARQDLAAAQARVDADQRAHSPGCVAVDQKGVDQAQAALAQADAEATRGASLSVTA